MSDPLEITFLASLPAIQSAVTFGGTKGDGARLKLDLPGTEAEAALLFAHHGRGRLMEVTVKFLDTADGATEHQAEKLSARINLRRS